MKQKTGEFLYFNGRLTQKLNRIIRCPMTIVKARVGAGKTTAVSTYLMGIAAKTVWHFCGEDYPAFYTQFCAYMGSVCKEMRPEIYKPDSVISPESAAAYLAVRLKESLAEPRVVYVLESEATAVPDDIMKFLTALCFQRVRDLHIVVILRSDSPNSSTGSDSDFGVNININLINDDDFRLTSEDVALAFQGNGVPMIPEEADYLLLYCDGWMPMVQRYWAEIQDCGKQTLYQRIDSLTKQYPLESGSASDNRTKSVVQEAKQNLQLRLMMERFDLEGAEIVLNRELLKPDGKLTAARDAAFLCMLKGQAVQALETLHSMGAQACKEGRRCEAEMILRDAVQLRVFLGGRYYSEASALIAVVTDRWLNASVQDRIAGCFALIRQREYGKLIAYLQDTAAFGKTDAPFQMELAQYYRELFLAVGWQHMRKPEKGRAYFEKTQRLLWGKGYYLAAFLLYDEIAEIIRQVKQREPDKREDSYLNAFLEYDDVLRYGDTDYIDALYWTENEEFKKKWACFRHNMKKNAGDGHMDERWSLTAREQEIIQYVRDGQTNREIGRQLHISENTVKTILKKVFAKLGIKSRKELK